MNGRTSRLTLEAFLQARLHEQLEIARREEPGVRQGRERPLHNLRVALRRMRTLLRAVEPFRADPLAASVERRLRRLLKTLGPARDMDVWLRFFRRNTVVSKRQAKRLAQALAEKETHRRRLLGELDRPAHRRLMEDVERLAGAPVVLPVYLNPAAREALNQARLRIERRARHAPRLSPRRLHRLRIAFRKARYLAEFFSGVVEAPLERLAAECQALQDVLGDLHDHEVYLARARALQPAAPAKLTRHIRRRRRLLQQRFERQWAHHQRAEMTALWEAATKRVASIP